MVLDAALVLVAAAPVLLGVGPALHPVGVAGCTIIDVPVGVAHPMRHVHVQVVAAMPGAGASEILMMAAPGLLVVGPSKIPVGVSGPAVVGLIVHVLRLVDHVCVRRRGNGHGDDSDMRLHIYRHVVVDHFRRDIMRRASTTMVSAAVLLLLLPPQVGPVVVASLAVERRGHLILPD